MFRREEGIGQEPHRTLHRTHGMPAGREDPRRRQLDLRPVNSDAVKREMAEAGFELLSSYDFTKADGQDYFLAFAVR
jgi:hypothetical protein